MNTFPATSARETVSGPPLFSPSGWLLRTIVVLVSLTGLALGQSAASLRGLIRDPQGAPLKQAQVRLFAQNSGSAVSTVSQNDGSYAFERLPAGPYVIEVEVELFRTATASVTVTPGNAATYDVKLQLAGVNQSVLVTASGTPQQLDEIAKAASTISGEEIQNRNEYSLGEILRNTPGMLVTNSGGPGQLTTIRMRGLRADATSVLVDGLRLRDTTTISADSSSLFSALNFIATDRVEVVRGSGSSLYGTNAVGGVVNVVTQQGGGPLHGQLQTEGGNLGFYRTRGTLSGGALRDRLKYTAGLSHLNVIQGVDGNDPWRSTGGQGFLRYDFTPTMNLSARLWGTDDFVMTNVGPSTAGVPTANFPSTGIIPAQLLSPANVALLNSGGRPDYTGANLIPGRDDPDSRRSLGFLSSAFVFRHALTPRVNWQASYQRVHTDRIFENGPGGGGFQPVTSNWTLYRGDIDTAELRSTAQLTPWMSITGGYEYERE
ncbi:MAG: TonB-dependent receptor plug domain-containing protein, partial [Acidobacteria bacterium]|nr:TonB-dependent receptor plug domain-containing protein [Acidobacteriota bacterium]